MDNRATFNLAYTGDSNRVPSKNILTPKFLGIHGLADGGVAEICSGTGMDNQPIFGVCVVQRTGDNTAIVRHDLSELFQSRRAADAFVAGLKIDLPVR